MTENIKSWGQDLNCQNSKLGCHTKLLEIPGSGAKVSIHFDCLYDTPFLSLAYFFIKKGLARHIYFFVKAFVPMRFLEMWQNAIFEFNYFS